MQIKRDKYLNALIKKMNNGLIKVVTGIRQSGKSYLIFNLFVDYLLSINVDKSHIIELSFDRESYQELLNHKKFLSYINNLIKDKKNYYILIDEIQYMKNFEPVLIELLSIENVDVYVTGSNSKFLSSDINTMLRGKNDTIHVYPLSFSELTQAYKNVDDAWNDFVNYGGLPHLIHLDNSFDKKNYLKSLFTELYLTDLFERNNIKHKSEFEELVRVIASSAGTLTNRIKIANTFKSIVKVNIKPTTIDKYLGYLENAFLISKAERYDINGRKYVGATKKYYFEDVGLKNSFLDFKQNDGSLIVENIVYNELKNRGCDVSVGMIPVWELNQNGNSVQKWLEIDFIVNYDGQTIYIQVTNSLTDPKTRSREFKPFGKINDGNKRIILTLDNVVKSINVSGVIVMNLKEFLLDKKSLN